MIFIGIPNKHRKFVRYNFSRWDNKEVEEKYKNSVRWLIADIMVGQTIPRLDFAIYIAYEGDDTKRHSMETPPGALLEVMFDDRDVTAEKIEAFLSSTGIIIKRANPFYGGLSMKNKIFNLIMIPVFFPIEIVLRFISHQK